MRKSCQRKIFQCARTASDCLIKVTLNIFGKTYIKESIYHYAFCRSLRLLPDKMPKQFRSLGLSRRVLSITGLTVLTYFIGKLVELSTINIVFLNIIIFIC